eukprot:TRINITY_DN6134_c0_g1_i3.p2 TRINITY_DN6134_c0_g1~~TRINITY_DN6134_c0_g1_i3.p2  ORF type:complete len:194 (+),score=47.40 TRINITY_DN6134_c0_g1_i3:693-1274(+)
MHFWLIWSIAHWDTLEDAVRGAMPRAQRHLLSPTCSPAIRRNAKKLLTGDYAKTLQPLPHNPAGKRTEKANLANGLVVPDMKVSDMRNYCSFADAEVLLSYPGRLIAGRTAMHGGFFAVLVLQREMKAKGLVKKDQKYVSWGNMQWWQHLHAYTTAPGSSNFDLRMELMTNWKGKFSVSGEQRHREVHDSRLP